MSKPTGSMGLRQLIASDLKVATGRQGFVAGLSAMVFEPGFLTIMIYRIARHLHVQGWRRLAKLVWRFNVFRSGCYLHLSAEVGHSLFMPHPIGVVIGEAARVGDRVTLYQGVTLGRGLRNGDYPELRDDAAIYANSVLIGGVVIGQHAIVGAGSIVTKDVPPYAIVAGNPARVLRIRNIAEVDMAVAEQ